METAVEEWLTAARDDLETVSEILDNPRRTHVVAFHTQQCVEKGFKAVLEKHEETVPNIHNLITLYGRIEKHLSAEIDVELDMLDRLNELYIDARYPGERGLLPEGKPSKTEVQHFHAFAEKLFETIRQRAEGD